MSTSGNPILKMTTDHWQGQDRPELAVPLVEQQPTRSEDCVDLTLIRWMLSLTPAERLQILREMSGWSWSCAVTKSKP